MGKKGIKEYVKLCDSYDTIFEGFKVPKNALYGRTIIPYLDNGIPEHEYVFWVFVRPETINNKTVEINIMKKSWNNNSTCNVRHITWNRCLIGRSHPVYKQIREYYAQTGKISRIGTFQNPQLGQMRLDREAKKASEKIGYHKHPTPTMRCYKQAMVDGKGYDISWEERVQPMPEEGYNGLPVEYPNGKKQVSFMPFEGITDTREFNRKNGMKVNQTKIRPQKTAVVSTTIVVKINGKIKE